MSTTWNEELKSPVKKCFESQLALKENLSKIC